MALNSYSIDLEAGSSQYLSCVDAAAFDITGNLTIECWIKFESLPATGETMRLLSKFAGAGDRSYSFAIQDIADQEKIVLTISADGTASTDKSVDWTPLVATWYHLAAVYTASAGTVDFYVNGAQQGTQQSGLPTSIFNSSAILSIGAFNGTSNFFDGLIDDIRLWATTRTMAQIDNNRRTEIDGGSANLNGYWKLNNDLEDATANNNDLTNNGAAVFSTSVPFPPIQITDTAGAPTESGGYTGGVKVAFVFDKTDTAGAPTEDVEVYYGWANTSKSSAPTWTNPAKT